MIRIPPSVDRLKYCSWKINKRKASKASDDDWKKRIKSILHCRRTIPIKKKMDVVNEIILNTCEYRYRESPINIKRVSFFALEYRKII